MSKLQSLTRADLAEAIYQDVGLTRKASGDLVDALFEEMSATLAAGDTVKISGFGNFHILQKNARIGRNPKTGENASISARNVVSFKASHILKDMVNADEDDTAGAA